MEWVDTTLLEQWIEQISLQTASEVAEAKFNQWQELAMATLALFGLY